MLTLWFVCIFILLIYLYTYWFIEKYFKYWEKRGIVHEKPWFVLGNFGFFLRGSFWDYFYNLKKKFPDDCVGIYLGLKPGLVVQTAELARKVLTDSDCLQDRLLNANPDDDPIGSLNLFVIKGPLRKELVQANAPLFTTARIKKITELMNVCALNLKQKIQRDYVEQKKWVNLKELMAMYVSDTLAFGVFGIRLSVLNGEESPLWVISSNMIKHSLQRGFEILTVFFFPELAKILRLKFLSQAATEYYKKMFYKVIKIRKESGENSDNDLVEYFVSLKEKFAANGYTELSENLMLAQPAAFIMASIETTTVTLTFACFELAYHEKEQEILFNEIDEAVRESGNQVLDYNSLINLKYLTAVINETLRKCVPLQQLDRIPLKDYQLTDDITVEKGVPIIINVAAIHHDERYFPEPNKWRPERFLNHPEFESFNYSFLPFGEGRRACIGKRYGMMQARAALAQIVHNFKIEPIMPYNLKSDPYSIVLAPIDGASVKFVPRSTTNG